MCSNRTVSEYIGTMATPICDWAYKNQPCEHTIIYNFSTLFYHNLLTTYTNTKMCTTNVEFNEHSYAI